MGQFPVSRSTAQKSTVQIHGARCRTVNLRSSSVSRCRYFLKSESIRAGFELAALFFWRRKQLGADRADVEWTNGRQAIPA